VRVGKLDYKAARFVHVELHDLAPVKGHLLRPDNAFPPNGSEPILDEARHRMRLYFPDTNFFLECRKASDLAWHELDGLQPREGPDIRLIVPSTVITEIERHKQKGNSRTAKRAREASAVLRTALTSSDHTTELRAANPRVLLSLPPVVKVDYMQFPNLDQARPDHRIAAEYAEVLKTEPGLLVLTDDTLLVLAIRSLGFDPVLIPEGWKLAPEKDERDNELDRLRDELKTYKQTSPDVAVAVLDAGGQEIKSMQPRIEVFEPSDADIDSAMISIEAEFPIAQDFQRTRPGATSVRGDFQRTRPGATSVLGDFQRTWPGASYLAGLGTWWQPPSEDDIEKYKTKIYPKWLESVRRALPDLASRLNTISCEIPFSVSVSNTGFVNASSVQLTVTAYDGILLLDSLSEADEKERETLLSLPSFPEPPHGRYVSAASALATFPSMPDRVLPDLLRPRKRDPTRFYYADVPRIPVERLELTCDALPHQGDGYTLGFRLVIPNGEIGKQSRIRVRLEASNLKKPLEKFVTVSPVFEVCDFAERLEEFKQRLKNRA
jgi:hypothetical protein